MNYSEEWKRYSELMQERPESFQNTGPIHIVKDWDIVEAYQKATGKTIGVCYESKFNILVVDLVYEQEGNYFPYERILPAIPRGAAVCVPMYQGKYILLRQYRHAMRDYQYAFPRGYATSGLPAEENARKETEEELGAKVRSTKYIGTVVADSGMSGQAVGIYLCEVESYHQPDHYEGIVGTCVVTHGELVDMICHNQISDGFTLAAYSHLSASILKSKGLLERESGVGHRFCS